MSDQLFESDEGTAAAAGVSGDAPLAVDHEPDPGEEDHPPDPDPDDPPGPRLDLTPAGLADLNLRPHPVA